MSTPETLQVNGLQLSNNDFSASPPGSLAMADNLVIDQKGVCQPRNGQRWLSPLPAVLDLPFSLFEFQLAPLVQYGLSKTDTSQKLGYITAGSVSAYSGTYNPVGDTGSATDYARMKFCLASLFLHFCTAAGPKTLETYNGTPRTSGLSKMPDFTAQLLPQTGTAFGNVVPYNSAVAYVAVHKRVTSTGQPLFSPPSNRSVVANRWLVPAGQLARAGATVTATFSTAYLGVALPLASAGVAFTLSPGEANFVAGSYVTGPAGSSNLATWANGGAAVVSTVDQELNTGALPAKATIPLPADAIAGDFILLYKSVATSDSSIDPSEDVYRCGEHKLTAGDIIAGVVTINDYTPETVLQNPLYTNPSDGDGFGLDGENLQPPIYVDVANWDSRTWFLNTTGQQFIDLQMLGVGSPNGVQDGDTLTVAGQTVTFKTAPTLSTHVRLVSDGTPAFNIGWTTYFLCQKLTSLLLASGVCAYGRTAPNGFPGAFMVERTNWGAAFAVRASRPESWTPALSSSVDTNSTPDSQPNGLWNSKAQEPESVPTLNFRNVGSSNFYGRRIFGLRNALIIIKEGDGIWSLTGKSGNYTLVQISTANVIAPDCAAVFADCVWVYTDQGILRITESGGAQAVSRPIDTVLNQLAADYPTETYAWSFAVPYEVERRILFYVPSSAGTGQGGAPTLQAFCYSLATNSWTGPLYVENSTAISGFVSSGRLLHVGLFDTVSGAGKVTVERKGAPVAPFAGLVDPPDYLRVADAQRDNAITAINVGGDSTVLELSSIAGVVAGTGLTQGSIAGGNLAMSKIIALRDDVSATAVQVADEDAGFTVAACLTFDPYTVEPQFLPQGGDPAARKALTRIVTLFKEGGFVNLLGNVTLVTDQMQDELLIPAAFSGFGLNPFGATPFGDPSPLVLDTNPNDPKWGNAGQFRVGFRLREVWCAMKLQGMALKLDGATGPVGRGGKPG